MRPCRPPLDGLAQEEDRGSRAVVGPAAAILAQPTARLENTSTTTRSDSQLIQIRQKRLERPAQLAHQARMPLELAAVGIEAVEMGIVNAGREAGLDQLGNECQASG